MAASWAPCDESESECDPLLALASSLAGTCDPWVILRTVPRVHAHDDRDLLVELAHPPHLSFLTVSTRVAPARPRQLKRRRTSSVMRHPRILSADLSASLFLTVTPAASSPSAACATTDVCCCFVLDAASCTSHRVPDPAPGFARFGVIAAPDGASFMVVGLRCPVGSDRAWLHCFSSRTGGWVTKDVNNPRPRRAWTLSDVIAHDGKLWWVDTSSSSSATKGLLYCDPFADQPSMSFVPFPSHVTAVEARAKATAYDHVQVAGGTLRWVHVVCDLDETADELAPSLMMMNGAPLLSMYAVVLGGDGDGDGDGYRLELESLPHWRGDFSLGFIWESDSFKATEMGKLEEEQEQPVVALMDPNDRDLLYFLLGDYLFGFDIRKHVVVGYAPHGMAGPDVSSSSLLAWKLPPAHAEPAPRRFGRREGSTNGGAH